MSYNAIVGKIITRQHPNADRLKLATIYGNQVIVGLDANDNELYLFFDADGQLSEEFAKANDLVGYTDPETGEKKGGYFAQNRRVRAQKFRGEKSDGFACPLSYLKAMPGVSSATVEKLKDGDQFCEIDGIPICNKYITRQTRAARQGTQKTNRRKHNPRFPQHFDTKQFRYEANKIPYGAIITLTEKLHGTSARYGYVQEEVDVKLPWYKRLLGFKPKTKLEYKYVAGTRRVVLEDENHVGFHGKSEYRFDVMKDVWHHLRKGEIIYGEIVGYTTSGALIMPQVSTSGLKDKTFQKKYGKKMTYKYGCPEGTCRFYVYRIAMTNEDGFVYDLPWEQVKRRAAELGLKCVPDLCEPFFHRDDETTSNVNILADTVKDFVDGASLLDESHIREGVAVRIDCAAGTYVLKEKSFPFKVLEGIAKDDRDYIDLEEQEDI